MQGYKLKSRFQNETLDPGLEYTLETLYNIQEVYHLCLTWSLDMYHHNFTWYMTIFWDS